MTFQRLPQDQVESESLTPSDTIKAHSTHDQWPRAVYLTRWNASKIFGIIVDLVTIILSCLFLGYGISVRAYDGTPVEGSVAARVLRTVSTLGPTIYPILFAAVVGKALKSMAFWRLEKGDRVGTMDQLLGSTTIFQTLITQFQMRDPGLIGIALIIIWALSPLGGQASLRVFGHGIRNVTTDSTIQYVNTTSPILIDQYAGGDAESLFIPVNALFGAALVGQSIAEEFSRDSWGNVKIPWVEKMSSSAVDEFGWYDIPTNITSEGYSSLLVVECNGLWLAILIVSTTVTAVLGICGLVTSISRRGPEPGLNISSLIKDSRFVEQHPASSTLDGGDRARMCKNVVVKYGDVKPEEEIGYIAIGSYGVADLDSKRLYD